MVTILKKYIKKENDFLRLLANELSPFFTGPHPIKVVAQVVKNENGKRKLAEILSVAASSRVSRHPLPSSRPWLKLALRLVLRPHHSASSLRSDFSRCSTSAPWLKLALRLVLRPHHRGSFGYASLRPHPHWEHLDEK